MSLSEEQWSQTSVDSSHQILNGRSTMTNHGSCLRRKDVWMHFGGTGQEKPSELEGRAHEVGTEVLISSHSRSSEVHRNQITAMVIQRMRPPPSFITMPETV